MPTAEDFKKWYAGTIEGGATSSTANPDTIGSTSIWSFIPGILTGASSIIDSVKGNTPTPVYNIYGDTNKNNNTILYIIIAVVVLAVMFFLLKK